MQTWVEGKPAFGPVLDRGVAEAAVDAQSREHGGWWLKGAGWSTVQPTPLWWDDPAATGPSRRSESRAMPAERPARAGPRCRSSGQKIRAIAAPVPARSGSPPITPGRPDARSAKSFRQTRLALTFMCAAVESTAGALGMGVTDEHSLSRAAASRPPCGLAVVDGAAARWPRRQRMEPGVDQSRPGANGGHHRASAQSGLADGTASLCGPGRRRGWVTPCSVRRQAPCRPRRRRGWSTISAIWLRPGPCLDQGMHAAFSVNGVIPGFSQGLQMMARTGIARFCIPAAMGYGAQGSGPIPANSDLVFPGRTDRFTRPAAEIEAMRKGGAP